MDHGRQVSLISVPKPSELAAHEIVEAVSEPPQSSASPTFSESGSGIGGAARTIRAPRIFLISIIYLTPLFCFAVAP